MKGKKRKITLQEREVEVACHSRTTKRGDRQDLLMKKGEGQKKAETYEGQCERGTEQDEKKPDLRICKEKESLFLPSSGVSE